MVFPGDDKVAKRNISNGHRLLDRWMLSLPRSTDGSYHLSDRGLRSPNGQILQISEGSSLTPALFSNKELINKRGDEFKFQIHFAKLWIFKEMVDKIFRLSSSRQRLNNLNN